jgi:hypothetical protein
MWCAAEWRAVVAHKHSEISGLARLHSVVVVDHALKPSNIVRVNGIHALTTRYESAPLVDSKADKWMFKPPSTENAALCVMHGVYASTLAFATPAN